MNNNRKKTQPDEYSQAEKTMLKKVIQYYEVLERSRSNSINSTNQQKSRKNPSRNSESREMLRRRYDPTQPSYKHRSRETKFRKSKERRFDPEIHTKKKMSKVQSLLQGQYKKTRPLNQSGETLNMSDSATLEGENDHENQQNQSSEDIRKERLNELKHMYKAIVRKQQFNQQHQKNQQLQQKNHTQQKNGISQQKRYETVEERVQEKLLECAAFPQSDPDPTDDTKEVETSQDEQGADQGGRRHQQMLVYKPRRKDSKNRKGAPGKLFHIERKSKYGKMNKADSKRFDFHQRKSKEIRRLQYDAQVKAKLGRNKKKGAGGVGSDKAMRKTKARRLNRKERKNKIVSPSEMLQEEDPRYPPENNKLDRNYKNEHHLEQKKERKDDFKPQYQGDPVMVESVIPEPQKELQVRRIIQRYPVWVVDVQSMLPYPAELEYDDGFTLNPVSGYLEVKEGDFVKVVLAQDKIREFRPPGLSFDSQYDEPSLPPSFRGVTKKMDPGVGLDCDFMIEDDNGQQFYIQIQFREPQPAEEEDDDGDDEEELLSSEPDQSHTNHLQNFKRKEEEHIEKIEKIQKIQKIKKIQKVEKIPKYEETGKIVEVEEKIIQPIEALLPEEDLPHPQPPLPVEREVEITSQGLAPQPKERKDSEAYQTEEIDVKVEIEEESDQDELVSKFVACFGSQEQPERLPVKPVINIPDSNCNVYKQDGTFLGRGRFKTVNHKWTKALLYETGRVFSLLASQTYENDTKIVIKAANLESYEETIMLKEELNFRQIGVKATALTLKPDLEEDRSLRQLFFIEGTECLEDIALMDGEKAIVYCENGSDYAGVVRHDHQRGFLVETSVHRVRAVIDDQGLGDDLEDINDVLDEIKLITSFKSTIPEIKGYPLEQGGEAIVTPIKEENEDLERDKSFEEMKLDLQRQLSGEKMGFQNQGVQVSPKQPSLSLVNDLYSLQIKPLPAKRNERYENWSQTPDFEPTSQIQPVVLDSERNRSGVGNQEFEFGIKDFSGRNLKVVVSQKESGSGGLGENRDQVDIQSVMYGEEPYYRGGSSATRRDYTNANLDYSVGEGDTSKFKKRRRSRQQRRSRNNSVKDESSDFDRVSTSHRDMFNSESRRIVSEPLDLSSMRKVYNSGYLPPKTPLQSGEKVLAGGERPLQVKDALNRVQISMEKLRPRPQRTREEIMAEFRVIEKEVIL